ncbi:DUF642 domain-containing protein [Noviherbaspirillum sp.]|uniref:DUF642 domain-containing protein n=1 Tax=Noviherbaspirillum sp. TaxID=1926288 RepID=UPI002FE2D84A
MKMKSILAIASLLATNAASAAIISNGNFEAGTMAPWVKTGNVYYVTSQGGDFWFGGGSAAVNGTYAIAFNAGETTPNGSIFQSFNTTAGARYEVSFNYGVTANGTQSLLADVLGANGVTSLGSLGVTDSNPSKALGLFRYAFFADGAQATLRFSDVSTNRTASLDGILDNVTVNAVPEPGTVAMLGLGLVAVFAARRRKT